MQALSIGRHVKWLACMEASHLAWGVEQVDWSTVGGWAALGSSGGGSELGSQAAQAARRLDRVASGYAEVPTWPVAAGMPRPVGTPLSRHSDQQRGQETPGEHQAIERVLGIGLGAPERILVLDDQGAVVPDFE